MWAMAALGAVSSIMGTRAANKNALRQQLQIVGDLKSANVQFQDLMEESKRQVGVSLTKNEIKSMRDMAKHVAQRADYNTAGASAVYAYSNFIQQKAYTKGTLAAAGEAQLRDYGKQSQAKLAQGRSGINRAQARKKSGLEATLDAITAGAQGYAMEKSWTS